MKLQIFYQKCIPSSRRPSSNEVVLLFFVSREIGIALGRLEQVTLVTGGFFGVGDTVAKSFFDERQRLGRVEDVWHILPVRDEQVHIKNAYPVSRNVECSFQEHNVFPNETIDVAKMPDIPSVRTR